MMNLAVDVLSRGDSPRSFPRSFKETDGLLALPVKNTSVHLDALPASSPSGRISKSFVARSATCPDMAESCWDASPIAIVEHKACGGCSNVCLEAAGNIHAGALLRTPSTACPTPRSPVLAALGSRRLHEEPGTDEEKEPWWAAAEDDELAKREPVELPQDFECREKKSQASRPFGGLGLPSWAYESSSSKRGRREYRRSACDSDSDCDSWSPASSASSRSPSPVPRFFESPPPSPQVQPTVAGKSRKASWADLVDEDDSEDPWQLKVADWPRPSSETVKTTVRWIDMIDSASDEEATS
mmetsp:Transcript_20262/g.36151  ORF Transcript_20262/g.36151 Transcript_20262/m.36151 type:complete len:299 (-) Transcript_20262:273-1169(-)